MRERRGRWSVSRRERDEEEDDKDETRGIGAHTGTCVSFTRGQPNVSPSFPPFTQTFLVSSGAQTSSCTTTTTRGSEGFCCRTPPIRRPRNSLRAFILRL